MSIPGLLGIVKNLLKRILGFSAFKKVDANFSYEDSRFHAVRALNGELTFDVTTTQGNNLSSITVQQDAKITGEFESIDVDQGSDGSAIIYMSDSAANKALVTGLNYSGDILLATTSFGEVFEWEFGTRWDITTLNYINDYSSTKLYNNTYTKDAFVWSPNGRDLFNIFDQTPDLIQHWRASTPWDPSTLVKLSTVDISTVGGDAGKSPVGLWVGDQGTKVYVHGFQSNDWLTLTLSEPWELSSYSFESTFTDNINLKKIQVRESDGKKAIALSTFSDELEEWDLAKPFDLSSRTIVRTYAPNVNSNLRAIFVKEDGTTLYHTDDTGEIVQVSFGTPWNISTLSEVARYDLEADAGYQPSVITDIMIGK